MRSRLIIAALIGAAVAQGLFLLMANLVSPPSQMAKSSATDHFIDFVRVKPTSDVETRKRETPEKPKPPKKMPQLSKLDVAKDVSKADQSQLKMELPAFKMALGNGPFIGAVGAGGSTDQSELPLVRIEPQYPRKAAMAGTEGWVVLKFDITENGSVTNIEVVQSQPQRTFDHAARNALLKWKYKPQIIDGKPTIKKDVKVRIDFKLENS